MNDANDWAALAERCAHLYTGAIADVLDRHGETARTLPAELLPLAPGQRLAGPAFPIEGRPCSEIDYDVSIRRILAMLGEVPRGHVSMYRTNAEEGAHLGELSVTSLLARGAAGAVIDGGCRDTAHILDTGFPVFCRYTTPVDCVPRWRLEQWGRPVRIGGVEVVIGDYIVADHDGIVAIPGAMRDRVLAEAEELVATENHVRAAVRRGVAPLEAYDAHGVF